MSERLSVTVQQERGISSPSTDAAIASRAIALCVGCPMVQFCAEKLNNPCESSFDQNTITSQPVNGDYRTALFDDAKLVVMAKPRVALRKPIAETTPPRTQPQQHMKPCITPKKQQSVRPTSTRSAARRQRKKAVSSGIADIYFSIVQCDEAGRKK